MAAPVQTSQISERDSVRPSCVQGANTPKPAMEPTTARPRNNVAGRTPRVRNTPLKVLPRIITTLVDGHDAGGRAERDGVMPGQVGWHHHADPQAEQDQHAEGARQAQRRDAFRAI